MQDLIQFYKPITVCGSGARARLKTFKLPIHRTPARVACSRLLYRPLFQIFNLLIGILL